jgi:hypothetical protein
MRAMARHAGECGETTADYAGFWRSTSYGGAYPRTLADPEQYWRSLESRFAAAGTTVRVDFSPTLILLRKSLAKS